MTIQTISPQQLDAMCRTGKPMQVIDVRTLAEFREMHAEVASNVPLDRLEPAQWRAPENGAERSPLYVICRTGNRAAKACEKLEAAGVAHVVNVEGGVQAWAAAGLPVVRGKKAISLERQVRIAAGSLVLLGAALAWWVHPAFVGLSAFVGAGLVFAGMTDTCGMGMLLAKMPWNQVREGNATGQCRV